MTEQVAVGEFTITHEEFNKVMDILLDRNGDRWWAMNNMQREIAAGATICFVKGWTQEQHLGWITEENPDFAAIAATMERVFTNALDRLRMQELQQIVGAWHKRGDLKI
jgi:hypothetical protein